MGCHVIDINPAALGADSITVMDFKRNVFTMPKKFSNLTPGSMDKAEMNHTGRDQCEETDFREHLSVS